MKNSKKKIGVIITAAALVFLRTQSASDFSLKESEKLLASSSITHLPFSMLFDSNLVETPQTGTTSVTNLFKNILSKKSSAGLVSSSLVYNAFFYDYYPSFIPPIQDWKVFDVPNSDLLLFIPKALYSVASKIFKLDALTEINEKFDYIQTERFSDPSSKLLFSWLKSKNNQTSSTSIINSLEILFQEKIPEAYVLDIFLNGHGSIIKEQMAGLSINEIPKLLSFLNKRVPTHILLILSCVAGGKHLNLLEFDKVTNIEPIMRAFNFIIIVAAVTDQVVSSSRDISHGDYITNFFSLAAGLTNRGTSLNVLLENIANLTHESGGRYIKNITRYPQIWIPGTYGFQTLHIDKNVYILNKVRLLSHMLESKDSRISLSKRPIKIDNKQAILLYPNVITVPIDINPNKLQTDWGSRASLSENEVLFKQNNVTLIDPKIFSPLSMNGYIINEKRYPKIISMARGDTTHLFNSINLLPIPTAVTIDQVNNQMHPGILTFIQDAFFSDIGGRSSKQTFLINSLTGFNDIHMLYKLNELLDIHFWGKPLELASPKFVKITSDLFKITQQGEEVFSSSPIILKNVIISSWTTPWPKKSNASFSFEINDTAWEYVPDDAMLLFKEKDLTTHRNEFETKAQEIREQYGY